MPNLAVVPQRRPEQLLTAGLREDGQAMRLIKPTATILGLLSSDRVVTAAKPTNYFTRPIMGFATNYDGSGLGPSYSIGGEILSSVYRDGNSLTVSTADIAGPLYMATRGLLPNFLTNAASAKTKYILKPEEGGSLTVNVFHTNMDHKLRRTPVEFQVATIIITKNGIVTYLDANGVEVDQNSNKKIKNAATNSLKLVTDLASAVTGEIRTTPVSQGLHALPKDIFLIS